jgi:DNA-directed RNA polymerase I, II, and III subunit RPABC2
MSDSDSDSDSDKYNSSSDSDNEDFAGGAKKVIGDIPIIDDLGDDEEVVIEEVEEVEDDDDEDGGKVDRNAFGFDDDVMSDDGLKQHVEDDDDDDEDENDEPSRKKSNKQTVNLGNQSVNKSFSLNYDDDEEEDDDDDENEHYLQKFNSDINKTYITDFHPECIIHNFDEVSALSHVVRDKNGIIIDDLHKTIPFLTKYERARILGQRAKQIECGSKPFVNVPDNIIDSYIIAEIELKQKKIPFIIRRPIPGGSCEYWNLKDLEMVHF